MKGRRKEPKNPSLRINMYILEKMKKEGILSILELSQRSGVSQVVISALAGARLSPKTKKGEWRKEVMSLAIFFECQPGALFGPEDDSSAGDDGRIQAEACFAYIRSNVLSSCTGIFQPERALFRSELAQRLSNMLLRLTPQEQRAISLCFGFDGKGERTLEEVGKELGISRPRAGQLKSNAFKKLQRESNLKEFYARE